VETTVTVIVLSIAVYNAAAHGSQLWRNRVCGIAFIAVAGELWREQHAVPGMPNLMLHQVFDQTLTLVLIGAMWALGSALGAGRRRARELLEKTVELESEREESARRAVFNERVRIARELHDVVAHHVSIMGVQAGAARVVIGRDPVKAKEALVSIEGSSRQAVLELHRLLGFLRQEGESDELEPSPGIDQLQRLAENMSSTELTIDIRIEGEERKLPRTIEVSAYRIVQEALTNSLKHSGASRVEVHLRYRPEELELEITDDGARSGSLDSGAPAGEPGGLGLIGMRERAGLHGGQLSAGPVVSGGFTVRATLPIPPVAQS
jgi:signal transduction histidine kinase